jgi:hypothetical protein
MRIVLAALVAATLVATGCADRATSATGQDNAEQVVGYRWNLVRLTDAHGTLRVPRTVHGALYFASNGLFNANDSGNFYTGRYTLDGSGYRLGANLAGTAAGYAGPASSPPGRTLSAVGALLRPRRDVPLHVAGDTLVVATAHRTLVFRKAGPVPAELTTPASPTATPAGG